MSSSTMPSLREYRPVATKGLVRVGRDNDGGYVLPRDPVIHARLLLSLGVNDDWSFEEGILAMNPAVEVVCVDGTTGIGRIVRKALQKCVDMVGYLVTLRWEKLARNARYLSRPLAFRRFFSRHLLLRLMVSSRQGERSVTMEQLFARFTRGADARHSVILKVDIEGAEFDVLPLSREQCDAVALLLVEFHDLDRNWPRFEACMSALSPNFHIAHLHGNNFQDLIPGTAVPRALEVTLVNSALAEVDAGPGQSTYPLPLLDMPNNWQKPDLRLSFE